MANATVSFPAETRTAEKKSNVTNLRTSGMIPAIVYSKGEPGTALQLNEHDFVMMLKEHSGENMMLDLQIDGGDARHVLVKEIQHHPLSNKILHVDFHEISLDRMIKVDVVIEFEGTPVGVTQGGGTLDIQTRNVEVECKASELVDHLSLDVSKLKIGDHVSASDLTLPANYVLLTPETASLATVLPPRVVKDSEESDEDAASEPEVVGAGSDDGSEEGSDDA
jgi:large subunit ribosomal protein L25